MVQSSLFANEPERENVAVKAMWFVFGRHPQDAHCGSCGDFTAANATSHARCGLPDSTGTPWRAWYTACGKHRAEA